jgi:hypothetical protein
MARCLYELDQNNKCSLQRVPNLTRTSEKIFWRKLQYAISTRLSHPVSHEELVTEIAAVIHDMRRSRVDYKNIAKAIKEIGEAEAPDFIQPFLRIVTKPHKG